MEGVQVLSVENLSLFRILSPSFIFSWTTIANISASFKCIVSYCCLWANETWRQRPLNNERRVLLVNTKFPTKLANFSPFFTALQRSHKTTISLENLNFFGPHIPAGMTSLSDLAVSKLFAYLFKYAKLFTKPLTRAPQSMLMKSFLVAID